LTAKAVAGMWKLPLLRLDMGAVFSGIVGSSEDNIRKAIKAAETLAPIIIWIDEIEKGLSGTQSSGVSDAGTTARVFGTLITWLQEKTAPVFVVAPANDISELPPALLRKGRFDDIFFVDLPNDGERREIAEIHLTRRGRDPNSYDLAAIADACEGFSGAEIEQAVVAGMYEAFDRGDSLKTDDILHAIRTSVPLSATMSHVIHELRTWARLRARPASSGEPVDIPEERSTMQALLDAATLMDAAEDAEIEIELPVPDSGGRTVPGSHEPA